MSDNDHFPPSDDEIVSRGSSVSTEFLDEYNQLLQYATILPSLNPNLQQAQEMEIQMELERAGQIKKNNGLDSQSKPGLVREPASQLSISKTDSVLVEKIKSENNLNKIKRSREKPSNLEKFRCESVEMETKKEEGEEDECESLTKALSDLNICAANQKPNNQANNCTDSLKYLDRLASEMKDRVTEEINQKLSNQAQTHKVQLKKLNQDFTEKLDKLLSTLTSAETEIENLTSNVDQKEIIVENLLFHLQKLKYDYNLRRIILKWKSYVTDSKVEKFLEKLAIAHRNRKIMTKAFRSWHLSIQEERAERIKVHCKLKAEKVLRIQEKSYNDRIDAMNKRIGELEAENQNLKNKNATFQKNLKIAFSKTKQVLNLETMRILADSKAGSKIELSELEKMSLFAMDNLENDDQTGQNLPFPSSKVQNGKSATISVKNRKKKASSKKVRKTIETGTQASKFWVERL